MLFVIVLTFGDGELPQVLGPFDSREEAETWANNHGMSPDDAGMDIVLVEETL